MFLGCARFGDFYRAFLHNRPGIKFIQRSSVEVYVSAVAVWASAAHVARPSGNESQAPVGCIPAAGVSRGSPNAPRPPILGEYVSPNVGGQEAVVRTMRHDDSEPATLNFEPSNLRSASPSLGCSPDGLAAYQAALTSACRRTGWRPCRKLA